jgi:phosphoribosyl-ATP pyrophosphohydrolase/phosphoribosyl-AMP cyclohydrolase
VTPDDVRFDDAGLVPGIVQDAATEQVLMLGYLDREALRLTTETGQVHFWSRSRGTLWRKGETSGHTLAVVDVTVDCDGDALLIRARPAGPTCHTGAVSCFDSPSPGHGDGEPSDRSFAELDGLWEVIEARKAARPEGSYTVALLAGGVDAVGRKVVEEATEVLLAAKDHAAAAGNRVAAEAADLVYHLLVLLAERGVTPADVLDELAARRR